MKSRFAVPYCLLVVFIYLGSTIVAAAPQQGQVLEQSFQILPGGTVEVDNPGGKVQVHTWDRSYVNLRAEKVQPPGQPVYYADLMLAASESTIVIESRPADPEARIDLTVYVPRQVRVQIGSQAGMDPTSPRSSRQRADRALPPSNQAPAQSPPPAPRTTGRISGDRQRGLNGSQDELWGPLRRQSDRRTTSEGSMGVGVRIIPPLQTSPDQGGWPRHHRSDRDPFAVFDQDPFFNPDRDSINHSEQSGASDTGGGWPGADRSRSSRHQSETGTIPSWKTDPTAIGPTGGEPSSVSSDVGEDTLVLNSELVNLSASVRDRSGQAIAGLSKSDFLVYEDGNRQEVAFFSPASAPFNLVLMLDLSGSTRQKLQVIKEAAVRFVDTLSPEDQVAVVTFTREVRIVSPLTRDRTALRQRIRDIRATSKGTALYEATWRVVNEVFRDVRGQRNAIVLLTDGVDNSISKFSIVPTLVSFDDVLNRVEETDVIIYPIYLDTEKEVVYKYLAESPDSYALAREQLRVLAETTGGVMFRANRVEDLDATYEQVASELRSVYSLGYYPSNSRRDGSWREVQVKIKSRSAKVRTRAGYYAK